MKRVCQLTTQVDNTPLPERLMSLVSGPDGGIILDKGREAYERRWKNFVKACSFT
jgi:hypothetical protein